MVASSKTQIPEDGSEKILLAIEKLSTRLANVENFSERLDKIQDTMDEHSQEITKLRLVQNKNHNLFERVFRTVNDEIKTTNVAEACGVDYNQIKSNQLFGENTSFREKEDLEEKIKRKQKEAFGAKLFTAYCILFFFLMLLSFGNMLPEYEWEKQGSKYFEETQSLLSSNMSLPFAISFVYIVVIFSIKASMKDAKPFNLRNELALWSLLIGTFSLVGSLRTVPAFVKMVYEHGWSFTLCGDTRQSWMYNTPSGVWTYYFILSKVPELIDTLFIVLRKRPLITLHWYHHVTVLCFCWHSWATCSNGMVFAAMNFTVHAFMYIFYSITALGYRPTRFAKAITIIQILQMIAGTAITLFFNFHMQFLHPNPAYEEWNLQCPVDTGLEVDQSPTCKINPSNAKAGLLMYASYLYLFCMFFYFAYIKPKKKDVNLKTKKEN